MRPPSHLCTGSCLLALLLLTGCIGLPAALDSARSRPSALRFGMYVTPDSAENPIQPPERFSGYHAGLDLEILGSEQDSEVPVYAVCSGSVLYSGYAEGYGGVLVQQCAFNDERYTVLYGHLDIEELVPEGTVLAAGDVLGRLAPHRSLWSGENRKHLHLGIHRGETVDMRGYVQTPEELADFIDPALVLAPGAAGRKVEEFHVDE